MKAKKFRKEIRKMQPDIIGMFQALKKWPLRQRLSLAWQLIKGR